MVPLKSKLYPHCSLSLPASMGEAPVVLSPQLTGTLTLMRPGQRLGRAGPCYPLILSQPLSRVPIAQCHQDYDHSFSKLLKTIALLQTKKSCVNNLLLRSPFVVIGVYWMIPRCQDSEDDDMETCLVSWHTQAWAPLSPLSDICCRLERVWPWVLSTVTSKENKK